MHGYGEGEVAVFSAKRWDRRNRADLIESATPCHDDQVVGSYRGSNPLHLTVLTSKSEDYITAPQQIFDTLYDKYGWNDLLWRKMHWGLYGNFLAVDHKWNLLHPPYSSDFSHETESRWRTWYLSIVLISISRISSSLTTPFKVSPITFSWFLYGEIIPISLALTPHVISPVSIRVTSTASFSLPIWFPASSSEHEAASVSRNTTGFFGSRTFDRDVSARKCVNLVQAWIYNRCIFFC